MDENKKRMNMNRIVISAAVALIVFGGIKAVNLTDDINGFKMR